MTCYIVTVQMPVYIAVEANDPEQAKGIVEDRWYEEHIAARLSESVDSSGWYVGGDVDLFDSDDTDVSVDESEDASDA